MFISTAWAQAAGGAGGGGAGDLFGSLVPLLAIFAVFYFLMIRPQQKKMKEHKAKIGAVRRGDRVVTGGGVIGTVGKVIEGGELMVEIAEGVKVRVVGSTLMDVLTKPEPAQAAANDSEKKK